MLKTLFEEKAIFRLTLAFICASLLFLLIFGLSLIFAAKTQAAGISVPRLDSDNDGILDFYEENVYGTDPQNADTDGDGFHDDMELMWGHDPLNANPQAKYLLSTFSPFLRTSDAYVSRHLTVKGNLVADDIVKIAKDLKVYGPALFDQNATFQGKVNLQGSLYNQGKQPVTIKDDLKVTKKITTKDLRVTNRMTVEDLTLRRGGKNRPAVGGVSGKPLVIGGQTQATGEWTVFPGTPSFELRTVPENGTVYFPSGVKFQKNPVINFTPDFDGAKVRIGGNELPLYLLFAAKAGGNTTDLWFPDFALIFDVEERILSSDGKVIGFEYNVTKTGRQGGGEINMSEALDITNVVPISWMAYGYE